MILLPELVTKSKSANRVYLIAGKAGVKNIKVKSSVKKYVEEKIGNGKSVRLHDGETWTAFVGFEKLSLPANREKLRKQGFDIYSWLKSEVENLQVEGDNSSAVELFLEGFILSSYRFDKYKTGSNKKEPRLTKLFTTNSKADLNSIAVIADATCWARDLVNEPVSFLTAPQFGIEIQKKCEDTGLQVEVFGKQKIESLKMGGLLAVNKGSVDPPAFIIMEWKPAKSKNKKPIVLVGKGIVYDTGGLSLKPTANSMDFMKSDMAGAAAMAAVIYAISKLKLPLHVITLIPSTDNRPGGNAYAPGDIVTMMDGTTVEVLNTDAEGRMALADALTYGNKFKPELMIDAATLTGAAVAAIGEFASIAMGNARAEEISAMKEAGDLVGDRIVEFPFWDDYFEEMKSDIADLKNLGGKSAGMITAGKFLEHFVKYPYVHLDIAGPSFTHRVDSYRGKGGTGAAVRMLIEFLRQKSKTK